jgi:hypothetical protein
MIHHILHRHKFYRLEIAQYHEMLDLLRQPRTDDPHLIQYYAFQGIFAFNLAHKYPPPRSGIRSRPSWPTPSTPTYPWTPRRSSTRSCTSSTS